MTDLFGLTNEEKRQRRTGTLEIVGVSEGGYVSRRQYDLAMAAGRDEGNKAMAAAGRTTWSAADYDRACAFTATILDSRLMPWPPHSTEEEVTS